MVSNLTLDTFDFTLEFHLYKNTVQLKKKVLITEIIPFVRLEHLIIVASWSAPK